MTSAFDKLNLRPQERRLVVLIGVVVFVVVNIWWVWPRFGDWKKAKAELNKAYQTIETYDKKIAQTPVLQAELKQIEGEGLNLPVGEQGIHLLRTVQEQARRSGIRIEKSSPAPTRADVRGQGGSFFEEQSLQIDFNSKEKELVDFLVNIGNDSSMIRVRDLRLNPDQPRQRLQGRMTLTASYQKKPAAKPAAKAKTAKK